MYKRQLFARGIQDCFIGSYTFVPAQLMEVDGALLDPQNRFRCEDAHIALGQQLTARSPAPNKYLHREVNHMYVMRGSRRLIASVPFWGTRCFSVEMLQTEAAITAALDEFYAASIAPLISLTIQNP